MAQARVPDAELEAVIFSSGGTASLAHIRKVFPQLTAAEVAEQVGAINRELRRSGRPYEIVEVAGGYQFRTRPEYGELLRAALPERRVRLSRAALETLSVIAYKQPLTRAEIEDLRCVDCGGVIRGLLERGLMRIVGRRDVPGRPVLYGTSAAFLETFGLHSLRDLPALRELVALDAAEQGSGTPVLAEPVGRRDESAGDESENAEESSTL